MPEAPSYTTVPGRIPELLSKIRETAVPKKATIDWLRSLGFTSSNDRSLLSVLRQIGFIDANGEPQPAWREYRGAHHRAVLGRAVRLGYEMLYATYPDAHHRSATDLSHVISTTTNAGKQAIDKTVSTFKNLVKEADFQDVTGSPQPAPPPREAIGDNGETNTDNRGKEPSTNQQQIVTRTLAKNGVTINVNVQLTIPETTDENVFAAFFAAMRKHLLDDNVS